MIKHYDKKQPGEERVYFTFLGIQGRYLRQEPGSRNLYRGHEGMLLIALPSMTCWSTFFYTPGPLLQGAAQPTVSHINYQSKEQTTGLPTSGDIFSIEVSAFQNDCSLCLGDTKN